MSEADYEGKSLFFCLSLGLNTGLNFFVDLKPPVYLTGYRPSELFGVNELLKLEYHKRIQKKVEKIKCL